MPTFAEYWLITPKIIFIFGPFELLSVNYDQFWFIKSVPGQGGLPERVPVPGQHDPASAEEHPETHHDARNHAEVGAGVARFFGSKNTKMGKIYQTKQTIPNGHKIYQQCPLQDSQKFTLIGIVCFENIPFGNPG
jgi:hypothetical protein